MASCRAPSGGRAVSADRTTCPSCGLPGGRYSTHVCAGSSAVVGSVAELRQRIDHATSRLSLRPTALDLESAVTLLFDLRQMLAKEDW